LSKPYKIFIDNELIGTSKLEYKDAFMKVLYGKITFSNQNYGYNQLKKYCLDHNIQLIFDYPKEKLLSTMSINGLKMFTYNNIEIKSEGNQITGMDSDGYEITLFSVSYPF